jgi:DNA gyrase/topoisomerase IV subunit B
MGEVAEIIKSNRQSKNMEITTVHAAFKPEKYLIGTYKSCCQSQNGEPNIFIVEESSACSAIDQCKKQ